MTGVRTQYRCTLEGGVSRNNPATIQSRAYASTNSSFSDKGACKNLISRRIPYLNEALGVEILKQGAQVPLALFGSDLVFARDSIT